MSETRANSNNYEILIFSLNAEMDQFGSFTGALLSPFNNRLLKNR